VPDVMIGVSARPFSKSLSSHVQQMGRVMRSYPSKEFGVWLDHSGNYLRFREDWDEVYTDGVSELDKKVDRAKKEPSDQTKEEQKCPKCGALWVKNTYNCASCGYVKPRKQIEAVNGELIELGFDNGSTKDIKQDFYSELLYIAYHRSYNPNWASHKYREKFGVWPRNLAETPKQPTKETMKWIQHRNIAWSKRQNKMG